MTLDEITEIDKEVIAARYEAAVTEEFGALAKFSLLIRFGAAPERQRFLHARWRDATGATPAGTGTGCDREGAGRKSDGPTRPAPQNQSSGRDAQMMR
jgi:hypothetical protein